MILTVSNTSATLALNTPETVTNGTGVYATVATGGSVLRPLPFPAAHNGSIAASGSKVLPMRPADWRHTPVSGLGREPRDEWNLLVQAGVVTLAYGAEAGRRDSEELFVAAV